MIITCGKCDTSYELKDELIKETGSKVRCKNCSNVFKAYPPRLLETIEPEPDFKLDTEMAQGSAAAGTATDSLDLSDIEKMLETQIGLGPDSIKITGEEPELSMEKDMEDHSGMNTDDPRDDLDYLDLSDIEKMLETDDQKTGEDDPEEEALDFISGIDSDLESALNKEQAGDALDLSDIEKMLEAEGDNKSGNLKITDDEPELSLEDDEHEFVFEMESESEQTPVSEDNSAEFSDGLDLSDFEKLLEAEETKRPDSIAIQEEEPDLFLEPEEEVIDFSTEEESELSLDLELDLEETLHANKDQDEELDLKLELESDEELSLDLEPEEEAYPDLELELELEMDEGDESEPETEEAGIFDLRDDQPEGGSEEEFALDLEEPEEATQSSVNQDTEDEIVQQEEFILDDEFNDNKQEEEAAVSPVPAKRKKSRALAYVLILLLLFAGGGYGLVAYFDYKGIDWIDLSSLTSFLPKSGEVVAVESSLRYDFTENQISGTFLVITGIVENKTNQEKSHIRITGEVLGADKKIIKSETVYCGNVINREDLIRDDYAAIKRHLLKPAGNFNNNLNVGPGGQVPFMVVFSDLPDSVSEFRVKVAGSENAQK